MIDEKNFRDVLKQLNFQENNNIYENQGITIDFNQKEINYPKGLKIHDKTTCNFSQNENFVVFECVYQLLKKGYKVEHIELEPRWNLGHSQKSGKADILVRDNDKNSLLIIECKTWGKEFEDAWKDTLEDGAQLFSYATQEQTTQFLCLYASNFDNNEIKRDYRLITLKDNEELLKNLKKPKTFKDKGNAKTLFATWKETYAQDYATRGLFEADMQAYTIGKKNYSSQDLQKVDSQSIQKKYHEFATILRQHNVSGRENAFDKLVNLFLAKIVDETHNAQDLKFYWKGIAYDDFFSLQDRLQALYKIGMDKFLGEDVTYIDNQDIDNAFRLFKKDPDATKETILDYFRQLKFFTNNDFAFIAVHNEKLFYQNAEILKKIVLMLQDMQLKTEEQNQFLGDLFEGFLDAGIKQSEGQFFTPMPIVKFLVSSLPLKNIIEKNSEIPACIDYACGAGHFLTEYAEQILPFISKEQQPKFYEKIYGIEKEYRLSKVAKVSTFMYGQNEINIIYADALSKIDNIKDNSFSVLVANPPYSVKGFAETLSGEDFEKFYLSENINDKSTSNAIECFFVERAAQLLKDEGIAAIILPSSILSNGNIYIKMREILLQNFDILAIAELGSGTFGKTGTNTATLFLRKKSSEPALKDHYKNRVEAWFKNNDEADKIYEDKHLLEDYCQHIDVPVNEYESLLHGDLTDALKQHEIFNEYIKKFAVDSKAKQIKKKSISTNYTQEDKNQEIATYILNAIIYAEKDKLYYFCLAHSQKQAVVIVKTPSGSKEIKEFLGYEWSGSKGNEGIKYIGNNASEDEEETISRLQGIAGLNSPLFNPNNYDDASKINNLIKQNFLGKTVHIPEDLQQFVSLANLPDMLDFSRAEFDKQLRTTALKTIDIVSKYPLVKLGDIVETIGGLWKGKKAPFKQVNVIRNTNFTMKGTLNLDDVALLDVEEKSFQKRKLEIGDIIIEKSGGSETQAVGRVVLFEEEKGDYSFSNFTNRIRILKDKEIIAKYLHIFLNDFYQKGFTFQYQSGSSGLKNLNINLYLSIKIPLPPLDIQEKIIAECNQVDDEYNNSRMAIETYKEKIAEIFKNLEVIIGGG